MLRSLAKSTMLRLPSRTYATSALCLAKVGDAIPISSLKDVPHPVIKPRSEYPEWLWSVTEKHTLTQLLKEEKSNPLGFDGLSIEKQKRIIQLMSRRKIKDKNLDAATK
jgi:hypothetical protein